uniref:hypothetical protein n=1 Tax=Herbidospora sakaeratensis TaxID=564415 RepID=UPI0007841899|nr:hypothetical protein [Herbidospora sakaeratensis]
MSPRRARRADESPKGPIRPAGIDRVEEAADGDWVVRTVTGGSADRPYRCPGCDQSIRPGMPHIVSWPHWAGGEEERRHWHTACWRNRLNRGPGRTRY